MRRWIALVGRLYPRAWRERYGEEFDALLDDATADWHQLLNVTLGAITMQVSNHIAYLKAAGALALAGGLLAMAVSYRLPPRYVSSAMMRVTPAVEAGATVAPDVLQRETDDRIVMLTGRVAGHDNVMQILQLPGLDLYPAERKRESLYKLAEQVQGGDLRVVPVALPGGNGSALRVSFAYPDRQKARAVVQEMIGELQRYNAMANQESAMNWKVLGEDWERIRRTISPNRQSAMNWRMQWPATIPFSERIDLIAANLPTRLPLLYRVALGVAGGLLAGAVVLLIRRRTRVALHVVACGLAGCAVAGALSFLIPERYTARAVLRITAPFNPEHLSGAVAAPSLNDWVPKLRREVLESDEFSAALRFPKLGLDAATVESLYRNRESAFGMRVLDSGSEAAGTSFEITFGHPSKNIARKVVGELAIEILNRYVMDMKSIDARGDEQIRFAHLHRAGDNIWVVAQPTVSDDLTTRYRLQLAVAGAVMGILLAVARWSGDSHPTYHTSINGESPLSS